MKVECREGGGVWVIFVGRSGEAGWEGGGSRRGKE